VTNEFLVGNGERSEQSVVYPEINEEKATILPYMIMSSDGYISSPDYNIPENESLTSYSFGIMTPHKPLHLLFVKNGKWHIINMKKSLISIVNDSVKTCELLCLNDKESLDVFDIVLRQYKSDIDKQGD
jgi:hypothetical protein